MSEIGSPEINQDQQKNPEEENRINTLQYLAGIFDVSGAISIQHNPKTTSRGASYTLRLDLSRTNPTIVQLMNQVFPASTGLTSGPSDNRERYRWYAKARKAEDVIEALRPYLRLKYGHLQVIDEFISQRGVRSSEVSEEAKRKIIELNKSPIVLNDSLPLSDAYVAGIFDAHGHISLNDQNRKVGFMMSMAVNNLSLMEQVAGYFGTNTFPQKDKNGNILSYIVSLNANKAFDKLGLIYPYLRVKSGLATLALEFQSLRQKLVGRKSYTERKIEEARIVNDAKALMYEIGRRRVMDD